MEINKEDFKILECSQKGGLGYIDDDRALELMELNYLEFNPRENWKQNGYKSTKKGTRLFNKWVKEIRETHGHRWETYEDYCKREEFHSEGDKYTKEDKTEPYSSAYSEGYHNGFRCKECGFEFCRHCYFEGEIPKCSENTKGEKMSSDKNLDAGFVAMEDSIRQGYGLNKVPRLNTTKESKR